MTGIKRSWGKLTIVACIGMLAFSLAGCAGNAAGSPGGITVTASSDASVVPDKARINVSVVTEGKTAEACQNDNAKDVNAVIEALGTLGVEETSIQTANTNLWPRYGDASSDQDGEPAIVGYEMTTTLRVSDLDIENVAATIQACVAAGANQADGIGFYASSYDEAYQQAMEAALETAHAKAEGIAKASGVNLGPVVQVTEGYQDTSARYANGFDEYAMAEDAASAGGAAKTMPGEIAITAEVTVTYAIR